MRQCTGMASLIAIIAWIDSRQLYYTQPRKWKSRYTHMGYKINKSRKTKLVIVTHLAWCLIYYWNCHFDDSGMGIKMALKATWDPCQLVMPNQRTNRTHWLINPPIYYVSCDGFYVITPANYMNDHKNSSNRQSISIVKAKLFSSNLMKFLTGRMMQLYLQ